MDYLVDNGAVGDIHESMTNDDDDEEKKRRERSVLALFIGRMTPHYV
jgi:hypothetical protein